MHDSKARVCDVILRSVLVVDIADFFGPLFIVKDLGMYNAWSDVGSTCRSRGTTPPGPGQK